MPALGSSTKAVWSGLRKSLPWLLCSLISYYYIFIDHDIPSSTAHRVIFWMVLIVHFVACVYYTIDRACDYDIEHKPVTFEGLMSDVFSSPGVAFCVVHVSTWLLLQLVKVWWSNNPSRYDDSMVAIGLWTVATAGVMVAAVCWVGLVVLALAMMFFVYRRAFAEYWEEENGKNDKMELGEVEKTSEFSLLEEKH